MTSGYHRYPTIHDNTVVFVSEDDLWSAPLIGGVARRLTSNQGEVAHPALSPDGTLLAFVGREEGGTEVYLMPAEGGRAQRLTFLGSRCRVLGWTPDGAQIIFSSNYRQPFARELALFSVAVGAQNGAVSQLPVGPARSIAYAPNGQVVLGRFMGEPANWKRYRGGTAGQLWIDRQGNGEFERFLADLPGNIASPMWLESAQGWRIFFVSDHEGVGNLYSCQPDAMDLRRHTDHEEFYVRNPASDGKRIVYHAGADLYVFDPADGSNRQLAIDVRSPRIQRNRRFVDAARYADGVRLHPSGRVLALTTRGKVFAFFNHDGPVLQYGKRAGVRYRLPEWLNDGSHLLLISDEPGEERIEIHSNDVTQPPRHIEGLDIGRAISLRVSPTDDRIAVTNHRHELLVVDLSDKYQGEPGGRVTVIDRSQYRPIAGFDWSPDGVWLAYGCSLSPQTTAIRLCKLVEIEAKAEAKAEVEAEAKAQAEELPPLSPMLHAEIYTITQPVLHDVRPAFDPDGNYLYFLSYREFNPVYDSLHLDLGFPWGMRPYLITLRSDSLNPFTAHPEFDEDDRPTKDKGHGDEDEDDEGDEDGDEHDEDDDGDAEDGEEDDLAESDEDVEGDGEESDDDHGAEEATWSQRRASGRPAGAERAKVRSDADTPTDSLTHDQPPTELADTATGSANGAKPKKKPRKRKLLRIDLEGIERRVIPFPVPDARYGQVMGIPGKVLFTSFEAHGTLDNADWEEEESSDFGTLRCHTFKDLKTETVAENVGWFELSRNHKKLLYASSKRLRVITAGEKAPGEHGHPRKTGWIDLQRVKVSVEPQSEWEQMFREAWRLQRDHFWSEDMSQVDWQRVYQRYFPLIERVGSRSEFSDLMWEMQGELSTSHAYEYGGDYRLQPHYGQGALGASFTWDGDAGGYRVDEIVHGDPWDVMAHSPLAAAGADVKVGDVLLAINGQPLDATTSPAQLLVNLAAQEVLLTFAARPNASKPVDDQSGSESGGQSDIVGRMSPASKVVSPESSAATSAAGHETLPFSSQSGQIVPSLSAPEGMLPDVQPASKEDGGDQSERKPHSKPELEKPNIRPLVVRTLPSETPARYRAWVDANRRRVHTATNGRIGYIHIPDMGPTGYAEFHRGYLAEIDRDGLIVDVRYNGGGHVSQLILEKLARRRIGFEFSRWSGVLPYPLESVAGPLVALTNELAGSDGDIFCHSFKLMKLGPLIGKRTWGGVIGISPRHALVDGTITTQPEYSFWFEDVGWNVENYGAAPDIEVEITPQDYVAGVDPQIERAIAEALALLEQKPILKPDMNNRPSRALPKLPPRA